VAFKSQSKFIDIDIWGEGNEEKTRKIIVFSVWRRTRKFLLINAMIFTFILLISNGVLINSIQSNEGKVTGGCAANVVFEGKGWQLAWEDERRGFKNDCWWKRFEVA
jgi:hypothetical protein